MNKKVIIIGGGFAGIHLSRQLDKNYFDILLIDKINHHQFQPLFYQVATSQIEPSSISFPLRHIFRNKSNIRIRLAEVLNIEKEKNTVITNVGNFEYDYLVIASGCKTNFFGNKTIESKAFTLKTTYDAITIRNHILQTFEKVVTLPESEKEKHLNLVIVGAGPTGVELAGAFAEIKKNILPKDFPGIDFTKFNIFLIEGSSSTLNNMSEKAKKASMKYLAEMGIKIMTKTFVTEYDGNSVILNSGQVIEAKTLIWAAGVTGNIISGIPQNLITPTNRIIVDRFNKLPESGNIFAIGDIAHMETTLYPKAHPQVANVAISQAKNLAQNLKNIQLNKKLNKFEYKDLGSMATIGNNKAVADFPGLKFKGNFAWFIWMFLHLMLILSVKNKIIIFINWAWKYVTKDSSLRLILVNPEKN